MLFFVKTQCKSLFLNSLCDLSGFYEKLGTNVMGWLKP